MSVTFTGAFVSSRLIDEGRLHERRRVVIGASPTTAVDDARIFSLKNVFAEHADA